MGEEIRQLNIQQEKCHAMFLITHSDEAESPYDHQQCIAVTYKAA